MKLAVSQLRTLRWAVGVAIESERDYIRCWSDRITGKSFDAEVTSKTKANIKSLLALSRKLTEELARLDVGRGEG